MFGQFVATGILILLSLAVVYAGVESLADFLERPI